METEGLTRLHRLADASEAARPVIGQKRLPAPERPVHAGKRLPVPDYMKKFLDTEAEDSDGNEDEDEDDEDDEMADFIMPDDFVEASSPETEDVVEVKKKESKKKGSDTSHHRSDRHRRSRSSSRSSSESPKRKHSRSRSRSRSPVRSKSKSKKSDTLTDDSTHVAPLPIVRFLQSRQTNRACGRCDECRKPPCGTCKQCIQNKNFPKKNGNRDRRRCELLRCKNDKNGSSAVIADGVPTEKEEISKSLQKVSSFIHLFKSNKT
jgi:hypothetical protein